ATGCKDSAFAANMITTSDPHALFISGGTFTCPSSSIPFQNLSTGVNYSSFWDFGDGSTSTITSPSHFFLTTGTFDIKLVITDQYGCSDSLIKNAYIIVDKPTAAFTVNDSASSCIPFQVNFTNNSQYFNTAIWDF